MNKQLAIKVDNVSKKYCKNLKKSMQYGVTDIAKNMIGMKSSSPQLRDHEFWAVNDISFEVKKGEAMGVIGVNGSGKTTLLKMLNGIFWPDKGKISIHGRVGALIAVGAGFHPMLSGRENIYLNASILGMSKEEVNDRFDDIVDFAEIKEFLDTPVKYYSSGMFVRLGFAVASHCEPDVLLIDEVLAVGDVKFREKCERRIRSLQNKDTSIVLVSHQLSAVRKICDRALILEQGKMVSLDKAEKAIETYTLHLNEQEKNSLNTLKSQEDGTGNTQFFGCEIIHNGNVTSDVPFGDNFTIKFKYECKKPVVNSEIRIGIKTASNLQRVCLLSSLIGGNDDKKLEGSGEISVEIKDQQLYPQVFIVDLAIVRTDRNHHEYFSNNVISFQVVPNKKKLKRYEYSNLIVNLDHTVKIDKDKL